MVAQKKFVQEAIDLEESFAVQGDHIAVDTEKALALDVAQLFLKSFQRVDPIFFANARNIQTASQPGSAWTIASNTRAGPRRRTVQTNAAVQTAATSRRSRSRRERGVRESGLEHPVRDTTGSAPSEDR